MNIKSNFTILTSKAHILKRAPSTPNQAYLREMRAIAKHAMSIQDLDSRLNLLRAVRMQVAARNRALEMRLA